MIVMTRYDLLSFTINYTLGNTQINGDLMVARRKLRSGASAPPKQESESDKWGQH